MDNRQEAARLVDETKITNVFALTFVGCELFQNLKTHICPFLLVCHLLKLATCTFCRFCAKIGGLRRFVSLFLCFCKVCGKHARFLKENHWNIWRNGKIVVPL